MNRPEMILFISGRILMFLIIQIVYLYCYITTLYQILINISPAVKKTEDIYLLSIFIDRVEQKVIIHNCTMIPLLCKAFIAAFRVKKRVIVNI